MSGAGGRRAARPIYVYFDVETTEVCVCVCVCARGWLCVICAFFARSALLCGFLGAFVAYALPFIAYGRIRYRHGECTSYDHTISSVANWFSAP